LYLFEHNKQNSLLLPLTNGIATVKLYFFVAYHKIIALFLQTFEKKTNKKSRIFYVQERKRPCVRDITRGIDKIECGIAEK
jgi:hypothetical protein